MKVYHVAFANGVVVSTTKGTDCKRLAKHVAKRDETRAIKFWKTYTLLSFNYPVAL